MAMGRLALKIHLEKFFGSKLEGKVLPSALNLVNWLLAISKHPKNKPCLFAH